MFFLGDLRFSTSPYAGVPGGATVAAKRPTLLSENFTAPNAMLLKPHFSRAFFLLLVLCQLGLSACSIGGSRPSPHLAATVASVAANYLGHVAIGQTKHLNTLVMWDAYLTEAKPGLTQQQYLEDLRRMSSRWAPEEHPLLGLNITEIEVDGDEAEVRFQKAGRNADEIRVNLRWSGTGWMVVDDSLFGEGGQIRSWLQGAQR